MNINKLNISSINFEKFKKINTQFLQLNTITGDESQFSENALYFKTENNIPVLYFNGNKLGGGFFQIKSGTLQVLETIPIPYDIDLNNRDLLNVNVINSNTSTSTTTNTDKINIINSSSILNTDTIYKNNGDLYFNNEKIGNDADILWEYDNLAKTRIRAKLAGNSAYPSLELKDKSIQGLLQAELKNQTTAQNSVNSGYALLYSIQPTAVYTKPWLHLENKPTSPFRYYLDPQNSADTYVSQFPINMNNNILQNIEGFSTNNSSVNVLNGTDTTINSPLTVANASTLQSVLVQNQLVNNGTFNQNGALTINNNSTFNAGYDAIFNANVQINGGFTGGTSFNNHVDGRVNNILNTTTNITNFFNSSIQQAPLPYNPNAFNVIEGNSRNVSGINYDAVLKARHIVADDDMACDIIYAKDFVKKPSSGDFFDFIGQAGSNLLSIGAKTLGAMALSSALLFAGGAVALGALDTGGGEESLVVFNNAGGPIYPNLSNVAEFYGVPNGALGDYYYGIGYGASNLFHNELEPSSKGDIQNAFSYGLSNWSNRIVINNIPVQTEWSGNTRDYSAIAYFDGDLLDPDVRTKSYPCALGYTHEYFYSVGLKNYENFQGQAQAWRGGSNHRTLQNLNGAYRLYSVNGILHFNQEPYRKYNDTSFLYGLILPPTNQSASPNDKLYQDLNNHLIWDSNRVLDASNYSSYALPLTGGTLTGILNIETTGTNFYKSKFFTNQYGLSINIDNQGNGVFSEAVRILDNAINLNKTTYHAQNLAMANNKGLDFSDGSGGRKLLTYSTLNQRLEFDGVSLASPFNQSGQQAVLKNNLIQISLTDGQNISFQNSFGTQGQIIALSGSTNGYVLKGRANNTDGTQEDKVLIDYQKIKFYEDTHHTGDVVLNNNATDGYSRGIVFDDSNTSKKITYDNTNDRLLFDNVPIASATDAIFTEQVSFNKGLEINDYLPSILANKLYSVSSQLYWNGALVGMSNDADKYFTLSGLQATSATGINSYDFNNADIELTRGTHNAVFSVSDTGTPANDSLSISTNRDNITFQTQTTETMMRLYRHPAGNQVIIGEDLTWTQPDYGRLAFKSANTAYIEGNKTSNLTGNQGNITIGCDGGYMKLKTGFTGANAGTPLELRNNTDTNTEHADVVIMQRLSAIPSVSPWTQEGGLRLISPYSNNTTPYCISATQIGTPSLRFCYGSNYQEYRAFINRTNASQIDFESHGYNLHLGTWNQVGSEYYLYGTHNRFAVGLGSGSTATWHLTSSGWANVSDRRIKSNIQDIDEQKTLKFLECATPKTYTLHKKFDNEIGFIAQDVEELGKEFVDISEDYIDIPNVTGQKIKDIIKFNEPHGLQTGGNYLNCVRFFCNCNGETNPNPYDFEFEIIDAFTIKLIKHLCNECKEENSEIFITGQKVNDFRNVNYTAMSVMTQRATQYLHKKVKALETNKNYYEDKIENLQNENEILKAKLLRIEKILLNNNLK